VDGMGHAATTSIFSRKRYCGITASRLNAPEHRVIIASIVHNECNYLNQLVEHPERFYTLVIGTYLVRNFVKL
jgi:hypothetical protein